MSESRYLTPVQAAKVIEITGSVSSFASVRNVALLRVLYGTGLMLSELASMQLSDAFGANGDVRDSFLISQDGGLKPVYLWDQDLRAALVAYRDLRGDAFPGQANDALFVDDEGSAFVRAATFKGGQGKVYHSYPALSLLISDLHTKAGFKGCGAETARRSWSVWMITGADGRPPIHIDWLRVLRGDKRLSTTVAAVQKDLPPEFNLSGDSVLSAFMRARFA